MKINFTAGLLFILISINYLHGIPMLSEIGHRTIARRETEDVIAVAPTGEASNTVSEIEPPATTILPKAHETFTRGKSIDRFKNKDPADPPEKTWKALQICGIIAFFVVVLYYLRKITKKFERNHDQDL